MGSVNQFLYFLKEFPNLLFQNKIDSIVELIDSLFFVNMLFKPEFFAGFRVAGSALDPGVGIRVISLCSTL